MNEPIGHFEELKAVPKRLADLADDAVAHKPAPNRWLIRRSFLAVAMVADLVHTLHPRQTASHPITPPATDLTSRGGFFFGQCFFAVSGP